MTDRNELMGAIIDHLLRTAPEENKGSVQAQIIFQTPPRGYSGALKKSAVPGVYELLSPVPDKENKNRIVGMSSVFFMPGDLSTVETMPPPEEKPALFVPEFGKGPLPSSRR